MSYDLFVQDLPEETRTIADIPGGFEPKPLGRRSDFVERIRQVVPEVDFSDPSWGVIEGDGFSIELNMGEDEELDSFAMHLRGGEKGLFLAWTILDALGLQALDPQSDGGLFCLGPGSQEGFARWKRFRAAVIGVHDG